MIFAHSDSQGLTYLLFVLRHNGMPNGDEAGFKFRTLETTSMIFVEVVEAAAQVIQLSLAQTLGVTSQYLVFDLVPRVFQSRRQLIPHRTQGCHRDRKVEILIRIL